LARYDVWTDLRAIVEETGFNAVRIIVIGTGTSITKVVSWPATWSLVGEDVDESKNDNVDIWILTNVGQRLL